MTEGFFFSVNFGLAEVGLDFPWPEAAAAAAGDGYDLFMRRKSSLVIRPSGGGVKLLEPRRGELEADMGLRKLEVGGCGNGLFFEKTSGSWRISHPLN